MYMGLTVNYPLWILVYARKAIIEVDKEVPAQTNIYLDDIGLLISISWEFDVDDHEESYDAGLCSVLYSKYLYFSHNAF